MNNDEKLREALLEIELLREREAERSRESTAILSALEAMAATDDAEAGIEALLKSIKGSIGCDLVALFDCQADVLSLRMPKHPDLTGLTWVAPGLVDRRRRVVDLTTVTGLWETPPAPLQSLRAMVSVPLTDGGNRLVLAAFSTQWAAFDSRDGDLLQRLATIASQAIIQRALEQRTAFLAAVIDESPVSVAIADAKGDMPLVYVNDAFTVLTGYDRKDVIGQNCRFLSAETADSDLRVGIRETVQHRTEGTFLLRNRRKSGEEFWNELRLFPIRGDDGQVTQMVATQSDATARITAEIERDTAQKRLKSALSATSEGFLVIGNNGHIRFANKVFVDLFGPDFGMQDTLISPQSIAFLLGDPQAAFSANPLALLKTPVNRETRATGGRQVLLRGRPIAEGGVVLAATDITQTKVNERILRQRLAAIEMSNDGIAIGDTDGRILHANPSLVSLWGLSDESGSVGRKWTRFYDASTEAKFDADTEKFMLNGLWRGKATLQSSLGTRTHEVSLTRVPDVGTVLLVQDITDRLAEGDERNRLLMELDRARTQEHLSQVSAGLAHDFNNLLSAILGSATLIEAIDGVPDAAKKAATRINAAAEGAARLVDGFLDLGLRKRSAERLDLREAIATTVDLARGVAASNANLVTDLPAEKVIIEASQTDLLQVVMNLILNGVDALEGRPGTVRVALSPPVELDPQASYFVGTASSGTSYAAIAISDTGVGMDKQTISKMLDPYFTTKGNDGSGLGLAIVLSLLSSNGCVMKLSTTKGIGSRFTIYWPLDSDEEAVPVTMPHLNRRGLPIMVVDDQADVAAAVAADLTAAGFEVAETTDPETALEAILEDPAAWACLVTDYDMPVLNGGDLVAQLAKEAPGFPVIVMSALARRISDVRVKKSRAILAKPVNTDMLITAVNEALQAQGEEAADADITRG